MLLLVTLFAILKIVFPSCMFALKSRHGSVVSPKNWNIEKNITLNTKGIKRGTTRINTKMT